MKLNLRKTPLQLFSRQLVRLKYLQHIQTDLTKVNIHKLDHKISFLNQSYVFHLIALWQEFIELLVRYKLSDIRETSTSHVLDVTFNRFVEKKLEKFNTPNVQNIDTLFLEVLNIEKITFCWNSAEFKRDSSLQRLSKILKTRHAIAHTGRASDTPNYDENFDNMKFLYSLAELLQDAVDGHK